MEWIREHLWESWLALSVVLGVAEMFSLDLFMLMLAAGAMVGMVAALVGLPFVVQLLAALATSVAMLAFVRPKFAKRLHGGPDLTLGHAKPVGAQAKVTRDISAASSGLVGVGGDSWTALPYDSTVSIVAGETVEVLEIRGATAYVHPLPRLEA